MDEVRAFTCKYIALRELRKPIDEGIEDVIKL